MFSYRQWYASFWINNFAFIQKTGLDFHAKTAHPLSTEAVFSCHRQSAAYWPQSASKIMWFQDVWDKIHGIKWKRIFLYSATVKMTWLTWRSPALPSSDSLPRSLSSPDTEKVIHALISSRHDCCKALYSDISRRNNQRLQMIRNTASRLFTWE